MEGDIADDERISGSEEEEVDMGEWRSAGGVGTGSSDDDDSDEDDLVMGGEAWDEDEAPVRGDTESEPGEAFAAAFAQILNASIKKRNPVLSRNTKSATVIAKERFEKRVQEEVEKQRKMMIMKNYVPSSDYSTQQFEKQLLKVATKGVVHLFNAVRKHQKDLPEEERERRKVSKDDKITKEKFMDILEGAGETQKHSMPRMAGPASNREKKSEKEEAQPGWAVLREDFVMSDNNKLHHWDQEVKEVEEELAEELEWEDEAEDL